LVRHQGESPGYVLFDVCRRLPKVANSPPPLPHSSSQDPVLDRMWSYTGSPSPFRSRCEAWKLSATCRSVLLHMQSLPIGPYRYKILHRFASKYTRTPARGERVGWIHVGWGICHMVAWSAGGLPHGMHLCAGFGDGCANGDHGTPRVTTPLASPTRTRKAPATGSLGKGPAHQPGPRRADAPTTRRSSRKPSAAQRGRMHGLPNIFEPLDFSS
jgi:hypothetical protein